MDEMNKKTTLKDIGEALDRFIVDEHGASLQYLDLAKEKEHVKTAEKDLTNLDLQWSGKVFRDIDPMKPLLMDDPTPLDNVPEFKHQAYQDILDKIKHEDERTDYSYQTLNSE